MSRRRRLVLAALTMASALALPSTGLAAPGAWTIVNSPNTSSAEQNILLGAACALPTECWAVGNYQSQAPATDQTLIAGWNGANWSLASSPDIPGGVSQELRSVACASPSECFAVGDANLPPSEAVIEQWNGSSWSLVTAPAVGDTSAELSGVACASVSQCVGCTSASHCWAVGVGQAGVPFEQPLLESWTGSSWIRAPFPQASGQGAALTGLACLTGQCWAVGWLTASPSNQTLIAGTR